MDPREVESSVRGVIEAVRTRRDQALIELTERWDRVRLTPGTMRVEERAIAAADAESPFARAFQRAVERIRWFHEQVKPRTTLVEDSQGALLGLRWTPLRSVGLYVPGGKASYPSTLAMTAIPAQIAGVERIVVTTPPGPSGEVSPEVLLAAKVLGLKEVYRVGGAQAVAALALGTETIPRVDKIFGPGNAFVVEAKKQLYGEVGIDLLAGPSEVVVYADETAVPEWAAADLIAQAEHDEATRVTLIASSEAVLSAVRKALGELAAQEPRRATIEASLQRNGRFEVAATPERAAELINEIAPEHLAIQTASPRRVLPLIRNAGAIFLGHLSPVAVGDYYAGPNHVLPTGAAARFASCLSVEDFMKRSNVCELSRDFLVELGSDVETLAHGERLPAHATSVALRRGATGSASGPRARFGLRSVTPYLLVEEDAEVKLNQNESPWDVPAAIKDEVFRELKDLPWNRYHQRLPQELLERIAEGEGLTAASVVAGSGSNLILQWVFEAYLAPGAGLVIPAPSFSLYPLWGEVCEARIERVPLGPRFDYDASRFEDAIRRVRPAVTVLCLPNNPTGTELDRSGVVRIARAAAETGGMLVIDEAYREFTEAEFDRSSLLRDFENVILVRTCSKAFSAAGMRLGYLLAAPSVATELRKMVPPFHVNVFAAVFGLALWRHKAEFLRRVQDLIAARDGLMAGAAQLKGVEVFPSHANFFLLRVPDAVRVYQGLKTRGILVRAPGKEDSLRNCLRVNAGTPEENRRFLAALGELVG
jgi:histidinol dehydrogenase